MIVQENVNRLNSVISYIEDHLDAPIEYKKLAKILCVNEYSLHRIFFFVSDMSLSEYIRKRRISSACNDLLNGSKVIEVAMKYQYESSTSFGRSFKKMMGFSPKNITHFSNQIKYFPILHFETPQKSFQELSYELIENVSLNLYSVHKKIKRKELPLIVSSFWDTFLVKEEFRNVDKRYGIVEYDRFTDTPEITTYHIAYLKPFPKSKPYHIENRTFLKFRIESRKAEDISLFTKYIYSSFIPYSCFKIDTIPDIEEYVGNQTTNIYIPVTYKSF